MSSQIVKFDILRSEAFGSISGTYTKLGTAFGHVVRLICLTNNTDGDMFISMDGVNDMLFLAANSFKLFDLYTNRDAVDNQFALCAGTQLWVRQSTAPTKGAVYCELIYGNGE